MPIDPDDQPLEHEHAHDDFRAGAHRGEDGDVALFFEHHHDQGGHDVQGGDEHDQADRQEEREFFELQR